MKVKVTPKHINQGLRRSYRQCPVALAICDAYTGAAPVVLVDSDHAKIHEDYKDSVCYDLPYEAVAFIKNFDVRDDLVEPFTFTLEMGG